MEANTTNILDMADSSIAYEQKSAKLGMWTVLISEALLIGGIFLYYVGSRAEFLPQFQLAAKELDGVLGGLSTLLLISSSLAFVLSFNSLQNNNEKKIGYYFSASAILALLAVVFKYIEVSHLISIDLYPTSPILMDMMPGQIQFFGYYYAFNMILFMHAAISCGLLAYITYRASHNKSGEYNFEELKNIGLYTHLVSMIAIFVFPLFYLI